MGAYSRFCRYTAAVLLTVICILSLFSCTGNKTGKDQFLDVMFEEYVADAEFLLDVDGASVSGNARITKDENVRIDLLSPDPYTGISVQGDSADKASVLSIEYSGIKADIPKKAVENLTHDFKYDIAATSIAKQPGNAFKISTGEYSLEGFDKTEPYEVNFSRGEIEYIYIYDKASGIPLNICAKSGSTALQVKINKFKISE